MAVAIAGEDDIFSFDRNIKECAIETKARLQGISCEGLCPLAPHHGDGFYAARYAAILTLVGFADAQLGEFNIFECSYAGHIR